MEGSRVAKKEGGSKLPWIIAGSVAGVLAAACGAMYVVSSMKKKEGN